MRAWAKQTKSIDVVIEKPLTDNRFFTTLQELLSVKETSRELTIKAEPLPNLVPEGAMSVIESTHNNEAEIFEEAVLFTDIRGSSQRIRDYRRMTSLSCSIACSANRPSRATCLRAPWSGTPVMV